MERYITNNQKYSDLSPEEFAVYIIENKSKISLSADEKILASLIGDSFAVEFSGNTNNGGNTNFHRKFPKNINGFVISNVAPDLGQGVFQSIFLSSNIQNQLWKDFYGSSEEIDLGGGKKLNATAYKKHFKIWAEINVAAAKNHGATKIVILGMGLGIYAGGIPNQGKTQLAELQFEILQEISKNNQGIEFEFFGVSSGSKNIGKKGNLTGIAFDAQQDMVKEADALKVIRVVAGSNNIILGSGGGERYKCFDFSEIHK